MSGERACALPQGCVSARCAESGPRPSPGTRPKGRFQWRGRLLRPDLFPDEGRSSLGAGLRAQLSCGIHVCGGRGPSGGLRRRWTRARRTASAPHLSSDREAAGLPVRMMRFVRVSCGRMYGRRSGGRTARRGILHLQFSRPAVFCAKRLKLLAKISGCPPNLHARPSNKMWCKSLMTSAAVALRGSPYRRLRMTAAE